MLHAAVTHPERVERLVLLGAGVSGFAAQAPMPLIFDEIEAAYASSDYERVLDLEEQAWVVGLSRERDAMPPAFLALARAMNRTKFAYEAAPVEYLDGGANDAAALGGLAIPALVVAGDHDCRVPNCLATRVPRSLTAA